MRYIHICTTQLQQQQQSTRVPDFYCNPDMQSNRQSFNDPARESKRQYQSTMWIENSHILPATRRRQQLLFGDGLKKKLDEQKENRALLDKQHWPWGNHAAIRPRGLRNLRLEGLFPQRDYDKAKRTVLGMGRPGGGAPNVNEHGARVCRTKEDPLLRFQWGADLRKCVDNTLRYRMTKAEQAQYKRELDKLVAEKFKQQEKQRHEEEAVKPYQPWGARGPGGHQWRHAAAIGKGFFDSLGFTGNGRPKLAKLERDTEVHVKRIRQDARPNPLVKNYRTLYGNSNVAASNEATKNVAVNMVKPFTIPTHQQHHHHHRQLTPLREERKADVYADDEGIELVPLLIEKRRSRPCMNANLGTTDVTRNGYTAGAPKWLLDGQIYLNELSSQMDIRLNDLKQSRMRDVESTRQHFATLDNFWGRPGHGAPRSALKKTSIDKLLYGGHCIPVAVA